MRLRCNMRVQFGDIIHEVGEVIERDYEEVKQAIRDRALMPLPDLPKNDVYVAQNAHDSAVKQAESANTVSATPSTSSDASETEED